MWLWLVALLAWNSIFIAEGIPRCEDALPSGFRFGGAIHLVTDCVWTPQVHFVTAISGRLPDRTGPLRAPTIVLGSSQSSSTSTGPSVVSGVVFQNFSLSDPTAKQGQVLWPIGLLQPGVQQGTNMPLRLVLQDVEILVDVDTLQQYTRFFQSQGTLVYTDNTTFLYIPWWSDEQTLVQGVGLLLEVPGMTALELAGRTPAAGRNFITAADNTTLVPLLTSIAGINTAVPFLVYLAANVSLGSNLSAAIPINRPVYFVGKVTEDTGIDFGMRVNQVVMLGTWSQVTFNRVSLENLGPGDQRTLQYAERFDVLMGYNLWSLMYYRNTKRAFLHNCTLVLTAWEVEEYLYKATLFKVQPAGFQQQLEIINSQVQQWQVNWLYELGIVQTVARESAAMSFHGTNFTSDPVAAARLRLPARVNDTSLQTVPGNALEHSITHVSEEGVVDIGLGAGALAPPRSEMMLLTVNMSFGMDLPGNDSSVEASLKQHLKQHIESDPGLKHAMMGIVVPSVRLNMGYSTDLVTLPPDAPPRYLTLVNLAMLRLSQGPGASLPGANMQTPDIYTHLLWSIPRNHQVASVWLSNVTMWVPASEFSYIRSFVVRPGSNSFKIDLAGGQSMSFTDVVDLQAEGLYVQHYVGPGMEADSLRFRMEAGWNQDGPPRGFWGSAPGSVTSRLSETAIIVLAVCSIIVVIASILGILAYLLWRRRSMEARAAAAAALTELGKGAADDGSRGEAGSDRSSSDNSGSQRASHFSCGAAAANILSTGQVACTVLDAPVHDSSDSYPFHERTQRSADFARSQFGAKQQSLQQPADDDLGAASRRNGPATSEAAFHRLHSAITTLSQDVLSRRLQVTNSSSMMGQVPGTASVAAGPVLGRASLLRGGEAAVDAGNDAQATVEVAAAEPGSAGLARASVGSLYSDSQQQQKAVAERAAAIAGIGPDARLPAAVDPGDPAAAVGGPRSRSAAIATASVGNVTAVGSCMSDVKGLGELKLLQLVGQGTFGQVYKALWRRRCVAVKVLQLPATAGGSDAAAPWMNVARVNSHREKMAVMETVVSTTMSHPNIVQVFTYVLQPLLNGQDRSVHNGSSKPIGNIKRSRKQSEDQELLQQEQQQLQQISGQLKQQAQREPSSGSQNGVLAAIAMQQEQALQQPAQSALSKSSVQSAGQTKGDAGKAGESGDAAAEDQLATSGKQDVQRPQWSGNGLPNGVHPDPTGANQLGDGELARLSPEMAAAAAAALPGATAAAAAASSHGGSTLADDDGVDHGNSGMHGPMLVGWELRLVMEFCDAGSLRAALDHKLLIDRTTGLPALDCVLFLAHDVACAMIHLHSEQLLHGDLKASNVLLKRTAPRLPVPPEQLASGGGGRAGQLMGLGLGLMAKVADFGLSLTLGPADTHVSQMHMGTLTHMAPELLLHGRASKSSDVYAYGILLWELATGRRPYSGTPVGMLAHKVAQQGWRPAWPGGCCLPVQMLAEACWAQDAAVRPTFEQIVQQLEDMAGQLEQLKQQQAQDMAAAAAPVYQQNTSHHELGDPGHELTPSLLKDLMPSGFSAGSEHSGEEVQIADSDGVYEMSYLSSASHDRQLLQAPQDMQQQEEWCIHSSGERSGI